MVNVEMEESSNTKREMRIEVPASEVDERLKTEMAQLQKDLKMPGFRKGRVPAEIVRKKFGGSVRREVAERIVKETFRDALNEHGLSPVAPPEIRDLRFEDGQPLTYKATVEIWPEISLKRYRGLEVRREVAAVTDEQVDLHLKFLRERHAELVPVERGAEKGDFLIVDYDVFDEEDRPLEGRGVRNYLVELGSEGLIKEFDEGLAGAKAGESRTVNVTFPEEGPHKDVAGKTLKFWVKLGAVKEKRLPDLDDDFAKEVGAFDRLEDLRANIREILQKKAEQDANQRATEALVDRLIQENPFDAPESMVENLLAAYVEDAEKRSGGAESFDREKMKTALRPVAIRQSKRFALLREVGIQESLKVGRPEVEERVAILASQTQQTPSAVREKLVADGTMEQLEDDLMEEKVLKFLLEHAEVENVVQEEGGSREGEAPS